MTLLLIGEEGKEERKEGGGGRGGRETGRGKDRKGRQTDTYIIHAVQSCTVSNSGLSPPFCADGAVLQKREHL